MPPSPRASYGKPGPGSRRRSGAVPTRSGRRIRVARPGPRAQAAPAALTGAADEPRDPLPPLTLAYVSLSAAQAETIRAGAPDAYGRPAERLAADGGPPPCRCCLRNIPQGREILVLAWRPFPALDPYVETCEPHVPAVPAIEICRVDRRLVKGCLANDRIDYGTGRIVHPDALPETVAELLADPRTACLHVRSAINNCCQVRIDRA